MTVPACDFTAFFSMCLTDKGRAALEDWLRAMAFDPSVVYEVSQSPEQFLLDDGRYLAGVTVRYFRTNDQGLKFIDPHTDDVARGQIVGVIDPGHLWPDDRERNPVVQPLPDIVVSEVEAAKKRAMAR